MKPCVDVSIGLIFRRETILICLRKPADPLGGYWEFPGGKRLTDETSAQCVVREIAEELDVTVSRVIALPTIAHDYPAANVHLHPFICQIVSGEPIALSAVECRWVRLAELSNYRFPPANDSLLAALPAQFAALYEPSQGIASSQPPSVQARSAALAFDSSAT